MRKVILMLVFTLSTQFFFAQDKLPEEQIQFGIPYPVVDANLKNYFTYNDLILAVKIDGSKFILQTYNTNKLTLEKIKVYDDFPRDYQLEEFIQLGERVFLFYSIWDKPNVKEQLFVREIDANNCSFIGEGKIVFDVEGKVTGDFSSRGFYNFSVTNKFGFSTSFDGTKLLIKYRKKPEKRDDSINKDKIGLQVFDQNIQPVWSKEVTMPYTEEKMDNLDYSIDSEGNTYIAALVYRDNSSRRITKEKTINYDIEIIKIEAESGSFSQKKINLITGKYISSLKLFETGDDKIACAGYYSSGGKKGTDINDVNGLFKFNLEKGLEDFKIDYYDIPLEIINQNARKKVIKKNEKKENSNEKAAFEDLDPETFYLADDGSILIIGEQYYSVTSSYTDANGNTHTRTTYYYNDILATKINKDGSLAWMKKLPKRQSGGRGRGGMSYQLIEGENDIYLVYMDNIKNLELGKEDEPEYHKDGAGGFLTAYKINYESGDVRKISLLDSRNVKDRKLYQFNLSRISSNTSDEFVFEVYKKQKEDILIKVELK